MIRIVRKTIKITLRFLEVILLLLLFYAVAAFSLPYITVNSDFIPSDNGVPIYVQTNGVHTDIVLPIKNEYKDWREALKGDKLFLNDTAYTYAAFGWGDKGFYLETPTWADLKFSTAFKAMFYLSSSAMHVTEYKKMNVSQTCKKINISRESYERIVKFIDSSFEKGNDGQYQQISCKSYELNDLFYEARGTYNLFYTCNTWTNDGLKTGKLKACLWTLFDKAILSKYD